MTLGDKTYALDQSALVLQNADGSCYGGLQAWADATESDYLFGAIFVSSVYM
jgi:hypothetical protein